MYGAGGGYGGGRVGWVVIVAGSFSWTERRACSMGVRVGESMIEPEVQGSIVGLKRVVLP